MTLEDQENRPNFYAVIPASIRYCKNLEPNAKLLYGEITALCSKEGYCWASNKYFYELYDVSERSIRNWLSALMREGFIRIEITTKGGQTIRKIWITDVCTKLPPPRQKSAAPPAEICRHINTSITTHDSDSDSDSGDPEVVKSSEKVKLSDQPKESTLIRDCEGNQRVIGRSDLYKLLLDKNLPQADLEIIWKIICSYCEPIRDLKQFSLKCLANYKKTQNKGKSCNSRQKSKTKETQQLQSGSNKTSGSDTPKRALASFKEIWDAYEEPSNGSKNLATS